MGLAPQVEQGFLRQVFRQCGGSAQPQEISLYPGREMGKQQGKGGTVAIFGHPEQKRVQLPGPLES